MTKYVFWLASIILILTLISCEEYKPKERKNSYDPENPAGRKFISVTPLTTGGVSKYPSWSPDEKKIAYYHSPDRSIYVMDVVEKSTEKLPLMPDKLLFSVELKYQADLNSNSISEDLREKLGDRFSENLDVSIQKRDSEWLIDDQERKSTYTVKKDKDQLSIFSNHSLESSPSWSPTSSKIAYMHPPGDISVRDYPEGDSVQLTKDARGQYGSITWSRDGTMIAYIQGGKIKIMNADGSDPQELKPCKVIKSITTITDWSPDGSKLLVIAGETPKAYTIDLCTNDVKLLPQEKRGLYEDAVWSADGLKNLYVIFRSERHELWIINPDGTQAAILTNDINPYARFIDYISWSKDESMVLFLGSDQFYNQNRDIYMMRMELR